MPAPFGPRSNTISPALDRERGPGQSGEATEDGDRVVEFDHGAWVPVHGRRNQPYVTQLAEPLGCHTEHVTYAPEGQGSDPCPVCGHPEDAHVLWPADETFDGWAHCTVGTGKGACRCWREWPRLPAATDEPLPAASSDARDWRYFVRGVGKVLIATGLLLGGFVAYQLWGTGIEARRAQNELEDEFEALLDSVTSTTSAPTSTTVPLGTTPATTPGTTPTTVPDTVPVTAPPTFPPIADGDPVARLEIPEIGLDVVVVAGVSVDDLRRGPGHYPDTPLPGQYGNAAIAGHRMTYDGPFQHVDDLEPGDQIIATTVAGRFVYAVTGTEIVKPDDIECDRHRQPRRRRVDVDVVSPEVVDGQANHRPQRARRRRVRTRHVPRGRGADHDHRHHDDSADRHHCPGDP